MSHLSLHRTHSFSTNFSCFYFLAHTSFARNLHISHFLTTSYITSHFSLILILLHILSCSSSYSPTSQYFCFLTYTLHTAHHLSTSSLFLTLLAFHLSLSLSLSSPPIANRYTHLTTSHSIKPGKKSERESDVTVSITRAV